MRVINFNDNYASTKLSLNELRISSFYEVMNLQNCILVLNTLNNEVPEALHEFFKHVSNKHHYNTRTATIIDLVYSKL